MTTTILTTAEALAAGLTPGVLRGPSAHAPTSGVRVLGTTDPTLADRCRAVARVLHPDSAFARTTALRLLGVEVPWEIARDDRLHVVSTRRGDRAQRTAVVSHYCGQDRLDVVEVDDLRVTSPAQTWLQVAHALPPDAVVVLADSMTRRRHPATTVAELRRLMDSTYKMRGIVRCREAIGLVRPGTDSSMETRTRLILVQAGLPTPAVNRPALDDAGRFLALPDLSYPELRIAIEYDGDVHRTDPATWRRDVERRQRLEDAGWVVVTATADDVLRLPERLVRRVRAARARRRARAWP
ncbi:hypothetical protein [Cellulosimicrobium marinum]|uniref:hypothetical protein n=1 Tax=Cellulosimicrobium marinum TaxID=1638992 RepID=UPI001E3DD05B|nr:hypothetical protein [Cellulosimicrobium marinum]MCB7135390.1 hypothetical protein [Cellulosimicrobium marinum]